MKTKMNIKWNYVKLFKDDVLISTFWDLKQKFKKIPLYIFATTVDYFINFCAFLVVLCLKQFSDFMYFMLCLRNE